MKALVQSYNVVNHKGVLLALVPFKEFYDKAMFTYKTRPEEDPYEAEDVIANEEMYQRQLNTTHLNEVKKYLREIVKADLESKSRSAIFPTSMLIAYSEDDTDSLVYQTEVDITLPEKFYVVDGQHRLAAMKSLYEEVKEKGDEESCSIYRYLMNYAFNCSILVNYDLWEQARIFADVNFNQKRVNKSLYYEIYGSQYFENPSDWGKNYVYVAHNLVDFMNKFDGSPLKGGIRMLGTGKGYVSQAFLVEALLKSISMPRGIWYFDYRTEVTKETYRHMSTELVSFFTVVKKAFEDMWPKDGLHKSILVKTTGIGAMLRLMAYLHQLLDESIKEDLKSHVGANRQCDSYIKFITPYISKLIPYKDKLFGLKGDFSGTGGRGYEMALYKKMREIACGVPAD